MPARMSRIAMTCLKTCLDPNSPRTSQKVFEQRRGLSLSLNRFQYHWDILRVSFNIPAMVIEPEFQSESVLIPMGDSENIPQCPSYRKRAKIPLLFCPNTIGTY